MTFFYDSECYGELGGSVDVALLETHEKWEDSDLNNKKSYPWEDTNPCAPNNHCRCPTNQPKRYVHITFVNRGFRVVLSMLGPLDDGLRQLSEALKNIRDIPLNKLSFIVWLERFSGDRSKICNFLYFYLFIFKRMLGRVIDSGMMCAIYLT